MHHRHRINQFTRATRRVVASLVVTLVTGVAVSGCMTGDRPTLTDAPALVVGQDRDSTVAEVLDRLESGSDRPVVARYGVLRKFGATRGEAVLARDGRRWSLTVGDVRYLDLDGRRSTCDLTTGTCTDDFDQARISDVMTTVQFADTAAITRLQRDAETATGPVERSRRRIAGRPSVCALVPQPGGASLWCANDLGLLAAQDTADMRITLRSVTDRIDPALFATTRSPG